MNKNQTVLQFMLKENRKVNLIINTFNEKLYTQRTKNKHNRKKTYTMVRQFAFASSYAITYLYTEIITNVSLY